MTFPEIKKFIADNISYKDWEFHVRQKGEAIYLQIQFLAFCNAGKKNQELVGTRLMNRQHCRKWMLSEHMTPTEIVRTCYLAVRQAEEHEMQENFKFMGRDIFNPHIDVLQLYSIGNKHDTRK